MKKKVIESALLFLLLKPSFSYFDQINPPIDLSFQGITIDKIDELILSDYNYISFHDSRKKKGILLSKKSIQNCINQLQQGERYHLKLKLLTTTEGLMSVTFRLYQNDIYLDGRLLFPKKTKVYSSIGLKGLCLLK
jgi:hypothetical protein